VSWRLGRDVKVGDVIRVWWQPTRDRVTALEPYVGKYADRPLEHPDWLGARVATFALLPSRQMTLLAFDVVEVIEGDAA
jgi:hypothetical protein